MRVPVTFGGTTLFTVDESGAHVGFNLDYNKLHPKVWIAYQISTNLVASNYPADQYPCGRYTVAESILKTGSGRGSVDKLRGALSAAHRTPSKRSSM